MIKTILTMVVTAIAGIVGYLVSDTYRERQAQKQRDKIASEVATGNEPAVNARMGGQPAAGQTTPRFSLGDLVARVAPVSRKSRFRNADARKQTIVKDQEGDPRQSSRAERG